VTHSGGLEVDESLLTGESEPVEKNIQEEVLSGSFVSAGFGHYRATRIGVDSYAVALAEEARRFRLVDSELRSGVDTILRWLIVIIPPSVGLLLLRLLATEDLWEEALRGTVASAVAMVPDGLVLLTSLSFITGVVTLARHRALCKELASVEMLARVDVLCLDKTGTITTGKISYTGFEALDGTDPSDALGAMVAADPSPNATLAALGEQFRDPNWRLIDSIAFSSMRKWAMCDFGENGLFHLGAPEILLSDNDQKNRDRVEILANEGKRILVLTRSNNTVSKADELPSNRTPVCLIFLEDTLREDAREILSYLQDQGIQLKVISGDHPATVAAVAKEAGISTDAKVLDARELSENQNIDEIIESTSIFGRVTPHQKRAMVSSLQSKGHTVAMTGDGVNDVLALKDSDMGIAMGSGSSASRAVAQLVLLDNQFKVLPRVLKEGRRVINNIERVSNLFITKATYAVLLTALVGILGVPFPFRPKQLTLIGTFSIGLPGFFLALAPDSSLVKPGFLKRVLRYSIPAGISASIATFVCYEIVRRSDVLLIEARTAATATLLCLGLGILVVVSRPIKTWKLLLTVFMGLSYMSVLLSEFGRDYFELVHLSGSAWLTTGICVAAGILPIFLSARLNKN
jgi:cation-transporting ATPase E